MATTNDILSYQSARGLMDMNLSDAKELFYQARKKFLLEVYKRAYAGTPPCDAWVASNRYFFLVTGDFDYINSGYIYNLSNTFVYACNPKEYPYIEKAATEAGATLTVSDFATWQTAGAFESFFW